MGWFTGNNFTGMSETGMEELISKLEVYCDDLQGIISGFDQEGDISVAFKGDVKEAAYDFIAAIKELLEAHVSTVLQAINDANQAVEKFREAATEISSTVKSDAENIRAEANSIRLD